MERHGERSQELLVLGSQPLTALRDAVRPSKAKPSQAKLEPSQAKLEPSQAKLEPSQAKLKYALFGTQNQKSHAPRASPV